MNEFRALMTNNPDYAPAYFHGGQTLERMGLLDEAREANAIRDAEPGRRLPKLLDRHFAVLGLVHRSANHVGADVQAGRQPSDGRVLKLRFPKANYSAKITPCLRCGRKPADAPGSEGVNFRLE